MTTTEIKASASPTGRRYNSIEDLMRGENISQEVRERMVELHLIELRQKLVETEQDLRDVRSDLVGAERLFNSLMTKYRSLKIEHQALIARTYPTKLPHDEPNATPISGPFPDPAPVVTDE